MSKVFFDKYGILVDDVKFENKNGDQYPIRNITSVKVRQRDYVWISIIGALICVAGLVEFLVNKNRNILITSIIESVGIWFIALWWGTRKYIILIGTGGMDRPGIELKKNDANLKLIRQIFNAINESIGNLQKS